MFITIERRVRLKAQVVPFYRDRFFTTLRLRKVQRRLKQKPREWARIRELEVDEDVALKPQTR
jgi:hypothetical protein